MSAATLLALFLLWQGVQFTLFTPQLRQAYDWLAQQQDGTLHRIGWVFLVLAALVAFCAI